MNMQPIEATVAEVVSGQYAQGTLVKVAGIPGCFTYKKTLQGNWWAVFPLCSPETAVDIQLFPQLLKAHDETLGPTRSEFRPPTVTITGKVGWSESRPSVIAEDVVRVTAEPGVSLAELRESSERAVAIVKAQGRWPS